MKQQTFANGGIETSVWPKRAAETNNYLQLMILKIIWDDQIFTVCESIHPFQNDQ